MEKDKLGQLQEAAAQNVALREQNLAMARRIELQQELALKEVHIYCKSYKLQVDPCIRLRISWRAY